MTTDTAINVLGTAPVVVEMPLAVDENAVALVMNADTDAGRQKVRTLLRAGYRVAAIAADPAGRSQITELVNKVESEFGRRIDLVVRGDDLLN